MSAASAAVVPSPTVEGDFVLEGDFALEAGGTLVSPVLHYALYGQPNAARDNVIFVCHALSGSAQAAQWWPQIFCLPGAVDLSRDCVLGVNLLGSCYGSTGPHSTDPRTGHSYGPDFPLVSVRDNVAAQARLLDYLGIARLKLAMGASIGAMQAIEWAILYPERVARIISIGVAPLDGLGLALNHLQRQAIELDPAWQGGRYHPDEQPRRGLALARALAVTTYKSAELFAERFARKPDRSGEDPFAALRPDGSSAGLDGGRFDAAGYLDYQGQRFLERFDANCYLAITRLMDTFDPVRGRGSPQEAYGRIRAEVLLVGISSDWLFPPADIIAMGEAMRQAGARCEYRQLESTHGHDAFLAEPAQLMPLMRLQE